MVTRNADWKFPPTQDAEKLKENRITYPSNRQEASTLHPKGVFSCFWVFFALKAGQKLSSPGDKMKEQPRRRRHTLWNPWGGFLAPIGLTMIGCTTFTGIIGGLAGKNLHHVSPQATSWNGGPAILGVTTLLFYDLATNYAYSLTFGVPLFITMISGIPFMLIHMVSNGLLFGLLTRPVSHAVNQLRMPYNG